MIIKLTNRMGKHFLLNTQFIVEVEDHTDEENQDVKSIIRTNLIDQKNKDQVQYLVQEPISKIQQLSNKNG